LDSPFILFKVKCECTCPRLRDESVHGFDQFVQGRSLASLNRFVLGQHNHLNVTDPTGWMKVTKKGAGLGAIFYIARGGCVRNLSQIGGGFPLPFIPNVPFNLDTLLFIAPFSIILAAVGLIESLMTMVLIDELTETKGNGNRECLGQGIANIVTGFFGGMGGCAMIGQSVINIRSGGRRRLSGIMAAVSLLCFILFLSSWIEKIPLAALTGVMFMVVIGTFEWSSFRILNKIPKTDAFVLILVSLITVFTHNLALAVLSGVVVSALAFA